MRSRLSLFPLCAAIASAVLLAGCAGPSSYELSFAENGGTLEIKTGDTVTIELEGNPSTGYLWTYGAPLDESLVIQTGERIDKTNQDPKVVGAPVKQSKTFKAISPGKAGVKLEYKRPWERTAKAAKTFEVMLVISGKSLEEPPESDETPRIGSDGKPAKEAKSLLKGPVVKEPADNALFK